MSFYRIHSSIGTFPADKASRCPYNSAMNRRDGILPVREQVYIWLRKVSE